MPFAGPTGRSPRICLACGAPSSKDVRFCGSCGAALPPPLPSILPPDTVPDRMLWVTSFPLLTNRFILYDFAKVLGFTYLIMMLIAGILVLAGHWPSVQQIFQFAAIFAAAVAGIGFLMVLVMVLFFGNRFRAGFSVTPDGVSFETAMWRAKWSNRAAVVVGALARSPGTAGAGLLAQSSEDVSVAWGDVRRVKVHGEHCVLSIMNGWRVMIRLYCTPENFEQVHSLVARYASPGTLTGGNLE
jgi:hypothetical protein